MTKTKLSWRLKNLPTADEVRELVKDKIITNDEARDILFGTETETDRDVKSLESEIKFLRELVDKLSKNPQTIITTIREVERPYIRYPWYQPYQIWCGGTTGTNIIGSATSGTLTGASNFSAIKTF